MDHQQLFEQERFRTSSLDTNVHQAQNPTRFFLFSDEHTLQALRECPFRLKEAPIAAELLVQTALEFPFRFNYSKVLIRTRA